jgi:4-carboxymuconolactone decarboxylase
MVHIAITNFKEDVQIKWLKPLTDEELDSANK